MEKPLLKAKPFIKLSLVDIVDNVLDQSGVIRPCPACGHTPTPGLFDTGHNQRGPGDRRGRLKHRGKHRKSCAAMPVCYVCHGRGHVLINRICQCGGAANEWSTTAKVWYCGDLKCLNEAIWWQRICLKNVNANRVNLEDYTEYCC